MMIMKIIKTKMMTMTRFNQYFIGPGPPLEHRHVLGLILNKKHPAFPILVTYKPFEPHLLRTFILKFCDKFVERGLKGGVSDELK
jgi:hypothetical protein